MYLFKIWLFSNSIKYGNCTFIELGNSVIVELIRVRNVKQVFQDAMAMIKGMGSLFSTIVALIIAAEVFATGIKLCGLITLLLDGANAGGLGITGMSAVLSGLIAVVSFLTGSGVGALTMFGSIGPPDSCEPGWAEM